MYRRHLKIIRSHLYVSGVVLVDPIYADGHEFPGLTVNTFRSRAECLRWCRKNGWPVMN